MERSESANLKTEIKEITHLEELRENRWGKIHQNLMNLYSRAKHAPFRLLES
jgi:hypothetical protein